MKTKNTSPKIHSIEWGKIATGDGNRYKDAKLFPGGSREWNWNETGTHHQPGIQPADIKELLDHGAEVVILSKGFHKRLQVCESTESLLMENDIDYHILQTEEAVKKYNTLCGEVAVGALIHSTC